MQDVYIPLAIFSQPCHVSRLGIKIDVPKPRSQSSSLGLCCGNLNFAPSRKNPDSAFQPKVNFQLGRVGADRQTSVFIAFRAGKRRILFPKSLDSLE